ncbi:MAG: FAD-dependent oxidoreductase [Verrucomicrobiota bacterium]|nr:FAD-dependent oxidoreductase [Verrucomicrobiota bacterium]MED5281945.1 FAD-dependent oxidoreductase [Verrucomicrobiota bacterium]
MKILVVGAGISGCVCAYQLSKAGHDVVVIEKGRGVGGRMATRRVGGARIDHGAQFLTARSTRMLALLEGWKTNCDVMPWYDRIPNRPDLPTRIRYRGSEGMTSPVKRLAQSFSSELGFFVDRIVRREDGWLVVEAGNEERRLVADHLVLTLPSVQMLDLFDRSSLALDHETMERLRSIRHTRCLALLGLMEDKSSLSHPGATTHPVDQVDWLSDNQSKGISEQPAFTLHASDAYSREFWEAPDEERAPFLLEVAEEKLGTRITQWSMHRWGFAKPVVTFGETHWHSMEMSLTMAGDGFGGERIENAALSGWDAADAVLERKST